MKQFENYLGPPPPTPDFPRLYAEALHRALLAVADMLHHGRGVAPIADLKDNAEIYAALHRMRRETPETTK